MTATATRTRQNNEFNYQNNHCARAFMFWYISLLSPAKQQGEMTKFKFFWRTWAHGGEFFIFLPYLNTVSINLVPACFAHNLQVERIGIIAKLRFQVTFSLLSLWQAKHDKSGMSFKSSIEFQ